LDPADTPGGRAGNDRAMPARLVAHAPYVPGVPASDAARAFHEIARQRRTVREFSTRPVPIEAIRWIIRTAGSAPSGANMQPWRFVAISNATVKRQIREAAEAEEREFYSRRANPEWLADLEAIGTTADKPFLESAPWLVAVFKLARTDAGGQVYYANESVGIAVGMLLLAAHCAGLATLTHTPSPMGFLARILERPVNERPYLLIPMGYPAEGATVPDLGRLPLERIMVERT
jgi:iodotyrosine deiodinase